MAAMVNMSNLLSGKDSRWLQLEVCREFQRNKCSRQDTECKFAHPPANVEVQNGKVTACYDSIKGRCNRDKPPCKYFHPPQHLKDQLLINGRNHLALKNALMQQMGIASGQPVLAGQVPTVAANPYLTGIPANTYSPYFAPGHLVPALLGPDPAAVASQLGPVVPQAVQVTQQKLPRSDRLEMDVKTVGSFYYENFAYSGMVPIKRPAAEKYGNPVYPGATTYQQLMQLQQPFVPISCEYQSENSTSSTTTTTAPTTTTTTINCTTTTTFAATAVVSAATTATTTSLSANITQQQYNHYQQQLQQHYNHQQQPLLPPQPTIQQQYILQSSSQPFTLNTPSQTVNTTTNNTSHQVINNILTNNNHNFNKYHYSSSAHTNGNCNLTLSTYNSGNNTKNTNNNNSKANNSFFLLYNNNNSNSSNNSNNNNSNNSNCLNYVNNNLNSDNKLIATTSTTKTTTINTLANNTSSAKTTTDLTIAAADTASNANNNSNSSINRDMTLTITDPLSINSIATTVANSNPATSASTATSPNRTETLEQTESDTCEVVPVLPVGSNLSSMVTTSEKGITTVTSAVNSIAANSAAIMSSVTVKSNDDEVSRESKHQYVSNASETTNINGGSDLNDVVNGCNDTIQPTLSTGILPTPTSSSAVTNAYQAHQNIQRLYQSYNTAVAAASYASVRGHNHYTPVCSTGSYHNIQSITVPSYASVTTPGVYGYSTSNTGGYYVDDATNITKEIAQKSYANVMKAASASTATTYTGKPLTAYTGISLNKAYVAATPAAPGSAMAHQAAALVQAQQAQAAAAVAAATQLRQLSSLPNSGLSTPVGTPVHTPVSTPALLQRAAPLPAGNYFHAASPATLMRAQPLALTATPAGTQYAAMPQQQQPHQTAYFFPGFIPTAGAYQFAAMGSMPAHVTASAISSGIAAAQLAPIPSTASTQAAMVLNPYKKMKTS
ncbi:splicing regulator muscleblind isoform 10-T25 [Glossina fuscipes fuscipes]